VNQREAPRSPEEFFNEIFSRMAERDAKIFGSLENSLLSFSKWNMATVFMGMATIPDFQSNFIRVSNLIHAALKFCKGSKRPRSQTLRQFFNLLSDSEVGRAEDPAEDVFVSQITAPQGCYCVFESGTEGATSFLEWILFAISSEDLTDRKRRVLASSVALLRLSNLIVGKLSLASNRIFSALPIGELDKKFSLSPEEISRRAIFKKSELEDLGISLMALSPFIFRLEDGVNLPFPSHHTLTIFDRHPLIESESEIAVSVLGIAPAISTYVVSEMCSCPNERDDFALAYIRAFNHQLSEILLLGQIRVPNFGNVPLLRHASLYSQEVVCKYLPGRPLHLLLLYDTFEGDLVNWENPIQEIDLDQEVGLSNRIKRIRDEFRPQETFRCGLTLIVLCGWGRPLAYSCKISNYPDWIIEIVSAPDLFSLSDHPDVTPLTLWRFGSAQSWLMDAGCRLRNQSGLLNLLGWSFDNGCHLVPHEQLPKGDHPGPLEFLIPSNSIAKFREAAKQSREKLLVPDINGNFHLVIRYGGKPYFKGSLPEPIFGCLHSIRQGKLLGVYAVPPIYWWCRVGNDDNNPASYRIWDALMHWLKRIVESTLQFISEPPLLVEWTISCSKSNNEMSFEEQIISQATGSSFVQTTLTISPNSIFFRPDNLGEKTLVRSFLSSIFPKDWNDHIDRIIFAVFPNDNAKFCHFFISGRPIDQLGSALPKAIVLHPMDDTTQRLGLGWIDQSQKGFLRIQGKTQCIEHLTARGRSAVFMER